ncbi:MAG: M28 family peptidase [Chloroflexota bacterium]
MKTRLLIFAWITALLIACASAPAGFDGQRALRDVETQLAFGPRTVGSQAHERAVDWMVAELKKSGWEVEIQETPHEQAPLRNVIAKRGSGNPWVLLGAHYDSRFVADEDPDPALRTQPVPGANDGASGVAVLLELARVFPKDAPGQVWLAFLDAEDNGRIAGWDWILGSLALAERFEGDVPKPDAVVIVDMIGDADLNIYRERNSDAALTDQLWQQAEALGYPQFIDQPRHRMIDDHIPFRDAGIPAVDIIDFDYPYWHTTADTLDKVSAESLDAVGETVLAWLQNFLIASR